MLDEDIKFNIISSRSVEEPPTIQVTFSNDITDHLDLTHYKMWKHLQGGCNYLGRLKNDSWSSAAVTGCLNEPGDFMEIALISNHNENTYYVVDYYGSAKAQPTPNVQEGSLFSN